MQNITIVDDMDLYAHGTGCQHIKRARVNPFIEIFALGDYSTVHEVWEDYNEDFIAEAKGMGTPVEESAHPITFYPCTGLVKAKTTYRGN